MPKSSFREILYSAQGVVKPILNGDGKDINTGKLITPGESQHSISNKVSKLVTSNTNKITNLLSKDKSVIDHDHNAVDYTLGDYQSAKSPNRSRVLEGIRVSNLVRNNKISNLEDKDNSNISTSSTKLVTPWDDVTDSVGEKVRSLKKNDANKITNLSKRDSNITDKYGNSVSYDWDKNTDYIDKKVAPRDNLKESIAALFKPDVTNKVNTNLIPKKSDKVFGDSVVSYEDKNGNKVVENYVGKLLAPEDTQTEKLKKVFDKIKNTTDGNKYSRESNKGFRDTILTTKKKGYSSIFEDKYKGKQLVPTKDIETQKFKKLFDKIGHTESRYKYQRTSNKKFRTSIVDYTDSLTGERVTEKYKGKYLAPTDVQETVGTKVADLIKIDSNRLYLLKGTEKDVSSKADKINAKYKSSLVQKFKSLSGYFGDAWKLAVGADTIYRIANQIALNPVRAPYNRRDTIFDAVTDGVNDLIGDTASGIVGAVSDTLGLSRPSDPKTRRKLKSTRRFKQPYVYDSNIKSSTTKGNSAILPLNSDLVDINTLGDVARDLLTSMISSGGMTADETPVQFARNKISNGLLRYSNYDLGNMALDYVDAKLAYTYKYDKERAKVSNYNVGRWDYKAESDPYEGELFFENPEQAIRIAAERGFTSGYSDWRGFSLGTEHMWGMRIYKYNKDSIIPALPIIKFNNYYRYSEEYGTLEYAPDTFDFGINPPVISYNLNFGTSREKEINMFNESKMMIPLGFSFQNYMSLDFADDMNGSIKKWLAQYFNKICKPDQRLMMPYIHAAYVIDLVIFKPGMKLMYRYKLIGIPINYAFTHEGSGEPQGSVVRVEFSIIGLRLPERSDLQDDSSSFESIHTWKNIMLMPTEGVFPNDLNYDE